MSIVPIGAVGAGVPITGTTGLVDVRSGAPGVGETTNKPFSQLISHLMNDANVQQVQSDKAVEGLVKGETNNVHDVVLSVAKADLSFRLMLEVRNRLLDSYQEIMRMQV